MRTQYKRTLQTDYANFMIKHLPNNDDLKRFRTEQAAMLTIERNTEAVHRYAYIGRLQTPEVVIDYALSASVMKNIPGCG